MVILLNIIFSAARNKSGSMMISKTLALYIFSCVMFAMVFCVNLSFMYLYCLSETKLVVLTFITTIIWIKLYESIIWHIVPFSRIREGILDSTFQAFMTHSVFKGCIHKEDSFSPRSFVRFSFHYLFPHFKFIAFSITRTFHAKFIPILAENFLRHSIICFLSCMWLFSISDFFYSFCIPIVFTAKIFFI